MQPIKKSTILGFGMSLVIGVSSAFSAPEIVKLPICLQENIKFSYQMLAKDKEFSIIQFASKDMNQLVLLSDKVACGRFVNVTDKIQKEMQFPGRIKVTVIRELRSVNIAR